MRRRVRSTLRLNALFKTDSCNQVMSAIARCSNKKSPSEWKSLRLKVARRLPRAVPNVEPPEQQPQEQMQAQAELPWKKYEGEDPYANLPTEQVMLQESLRKKESSIANEALLREADIAVREVGYSAKLLVQATLPHSKPADGATEFKRSNGFVRVKIIADSDYGLPFGTYPRLLLTWVTTEATRTRSPQLVLGNSLSEFMSKLDLNSDNGGKRGTIPRVREHMQRLFTSTVSATYEREGESRHIGFRPVEDAHLFWDPKSPTQGALWQSTIELNQKFYEEITRHPVPVDMAALRALAKTKSPLALDIYQWLTCRMSYLREDVTIPWETLRLQFGCAEKSEEYPTRAFKQQFVRRLKQVLAVYPDARVVPCNSGLLLKPSPTHVPLLPSKT